MLNLDGLRRAAEQFESEVVEIRGLPAPARFRDVQGTDRDRLTTFWHNAGDAGDSRIWEYKRLVVALSLCDDAGARVVPDDQIESVLGALGGCILDAMFEVAVRVSHLLPGAFEAAEKN